MNRRAKATTYAESATFSTLGCRDENTVPVLLLHGLGADHSQLIPYLAGTDEFVIAPDQRAHGSDTSPTGHDDLDFHQLAADQLALMDRLELDTFAVCGLSMGSAVGLTMFAMAPERITGLALIRPAWLDRPNPPNLDAIALAGELLLCCPNVEQASAHLRRSAAYLAIAETSAAGASSLVGQLDAPHARERADRLVCVPASAPLWPADPPTIQTLVVGAEGDPVHPLTIAQEWAERLGAPLRNIRSRDVDPSGYQADLTSAMRAFTFHLRAGQP